MALKHDAQGFLVGDPIDLRKAEAHLAAIRGDVRAILKAMLGAPSLAELNSRSSTPSLPGQQADKAATPKPAPMQEMALPPSAPTALAPRQAMEPPATPAKRGASVARSDAEAVSALTGAVAELRASRLATQRVPAKPLGRDNRGRFVRNANANAASPKKAGRSNGAEADDGDADEKAEGALSAIGSRIVDAVKASGAGMEEADPAVKAFNEVAQPMARGYELLTGGDGQKKQERWLRRIWTAITGFRKEEGLFNKLAGKRLKAIEDKPVSDEKNGGGLFGGLPKMLGGLLMRLPVIGPLIGGAIGMGKKLFGGKGRLLGAAAGIGGKGATAAAQEAGAVAKGVGAAGKGAGLLGKAGGLLSKSGRLLKRIPVLGALLTGGMAIGSALGMDDDPDKTPEENRSQRYKGTGGALGMGVGAAIGGALGSALGPVGTVVGGYLGSMAGEMIGEKAGLWAKEMIDADIPGKIVGAWNTTTAFIGGLWDSLVADAKSTWEDIASTASEWWGAMTNAAGKLTDKVSELANSANDWIKAKTGVDVKASAGAALEKTKEGASSAWSATKQWAGEKASQAAGFVKENAGALVPKTIKRAVAAGAAAATQAKAGYDEARGKPTDAPAPTPGLQTGARAAGSAVGSAANWALGQTSKAFESGSGGAGTVSSGKGDFGGASYGTYQLSSSQGTLQQFLKSSKYGEQFSGLQPGTPEFNAKWKDLAKSEPDFGDAQHSFIKSTHYDPALSGLKDAGIDLSGRSAAVQDAIWSSSVQFGAGNAKRGTGAIGMFKKALDGRDVAKMSDQDIVSAVQDYKIANNDKLFAKSSAAVRDGTAKRAVNEKERLLALAGSPSSQAAPQPAAQTGGVSAKADPVVAQPAAPSVPSVVAAPVVPVVASVRVPSAPSAPMPPALAEAQQITMPLASNTARQQITVASGQGDVGQDLRERGIAHIVTGGLAAS